MVRFIQSKSTNNRSWCGTGLWATLLVIVLLTSCNDEVERLDSYLVETIDSTSFEAHTPIVLRAQRGELYVVVSSNSIVRKELDIGTEWLMVKEGMNLTLNLKQVDTVLTIEPNSSDRSIPLQVVYPPLGPENFVKNEEGEYELIGRNPNNDPEYLIDTLIFYANTRIQCKVYQSDDIVGTYVRKSVVVDK